MTIPGASQAKIDLSRRTPDFFSCKTCKGTLSIGGLCENLRSEGRCKLDMLRLAIELGMLQIHISSEPSVSHIPQAIVIEGR